MDKQNQDLVSSGQAEITVGGHKYNVAAGQSFKSVISELSLKHGFTNIRVRTIDPGTNLPVEISASKAPDVIFPGQVIDVTPYDRAGR